MAALVRAGAKGVGLRLQRSRDACPWRFVERRAQAGASGARRRRGSSPGPCRRAGVSTPEETSTRSRAAQRDRLGDVLGRQPAGQHPRRAPRKPGDEPPVEGEAVAAGQRSALARRLRVEQQLVGDLGVGVERRRGRSPSAIPTAFITGRPKRARIAATRSGLSRPWSWRMSDRRGVDDRQLLVRDRR